MRQIPAGVVTQIPARGGYTAAGPIMKQRWLAEYHGANWANLTGAWESTMCSYVTTAAIGMLIREFEGRGGEYPIKAARATQLEGARTATCQPDGSPQPTRAEDIVVRAFDCGLIYVIPDALIVHRPSLTGSRRLISCACDGGRSHPTASAPTASSACG